MNNKSYWLGVVAGVTSSIFAGIMTLPKAFDVTWQKQAIEHGCAHFVITDPATGKTEFQWKTHEQP